jgi:hypothetical protein
MDTSIGRRLNLTLWIADIAALSVIVFVRRRLGYRTIELGRIVFLFFFLVFGVTWIIGLTNWIHLTDMNGLSGSGPLILFFAFPMLGLAIFHRFRHWRDIKRADLRWMTTSRGVSHFEHLPISPNVIYRFVDAGVCFLSGAIINVVFDMKLLGDWIMFSAIMFLIVEQQHYNAQLHHSLDMLDSMIAARAQSRLVQYYSAQEQQGCLSRVETAGLPTGIGRDVERLIAERFANAAAVGNLAPSATTGATPDELAREAVERGAFRGAAAAAAAAGAEGSADPTVAAPDNLAGPGRA